MWVVINIMLCGLTDNVEITVGEEFTSYVSASSFFCAYYGFYPLDQDQDQDK